MQADVCSHLPRKDAAQADDDQDVEDGRADDGAHAHVPFGDEDACGWLEEGVIRSLNFKEMRRRNGDQKSF